MQKPMMALAALLALLPFLSGGGEKDVTILFTNDAHAHIDNREGKGLRYSHVALLKKTCAEKGPVFLVDAGDYLQGTAYGAFDGGEQIVGLMNAVGYDVATVGNHEFDFHATNLHIRARQAKFPVVSCNAWRRNSAEGEKTPAFAAYAVLTNRGVSVAFVGLTVPNTVVSESPGNFRDSTGGGSGLGFLGLSRVCGRRALRPCAGGGGCGSGVGAGLCRAPGARWHAGRAEALSQL